MPTFYTVTPERQQSVYGALQEIAKNFDDTVDEKNLEELSQQDLFIFARDNPETVFIELEVDGKIAPVFDSNLVTNLWHLLKQRDSNNDGIIDDNLLQTPLTISNAVPLDTARPERLAELEHQYQDSIFEITVTRGENSTKTCYGCIIDKIDNGDGTFTYSVVSDSQVLDDYFREEKAYTLQSLSGNLKIREAQLLAASRESSVAVLNFVSPVSLTVCPLGTAGDQALYILGHDKESAQVNDFHARANTGEDMCFPTTNILVRRPIDDKQNIGAPTFTDAGMFAGFISFKAVEPPSRWHIVTADIIRDVYTRMSQNNDGTVTYSNWGLITESYAIDDTRRLTLPDSKLQQSNVGIWVNQVEAGSAAALAKIQVGDILLSIDGDKTPVLHNPTFETDEFRAFTLTSDPSKKYRVTLYRPSLNQTITVTLTPQTRNYKQIVTYETPNGFSVADRTDYDLELRGITAPVDGVWVYNQKTDENGNVIRTAEILPGLSHRDMIVMLNGKATPNVETFRALFEEAKANNQQINLTVVKTARSGYYYHIGDTGTCVLPAKK